MIPRTAYEDFLATKLSQGSSFPVHTIFKEDRLHAQWGLRRGKPYRKIFAGTSNNMPLFSVMTISYEELIEDLYSAQIPLAEATSKL